MGFELHLLQAGQYPIILTHFDVHRTRAEFIKLSCSYLTSYPGRCDEIMGLCSLVLLALVVSYCDIRNIQVLSPT